MKTKDVVVALEAIAQESRLGIYRLLVQAGPEGLPAGRIAERLKLPAPTLSFHVAQLKRCGLVSRERRGTSLVYSANFNAMNEIVSYLTENCCGRGVQCAPVCEVSETKARKAGGIKPRWPNRGGICGTKGAEHPFSLYR